MVYFTDLHTNIHRHTALRVIASFLLVGLVIHPFPSETVYSAGLQSPSLIVNTEAFQMIDTGNGTDPIALRFGATTNFIQFSGGVFRFSAGINAPGTISGTTLNANTLLTGSTVQGFGLYDCQGTANKLTYNATTKKFLCEPDQTGGVGSSPEVGTASFSGATLRLGDARYVKKAGDTMTGALTIKNGNADTATSTPLLSVRGTMSGRALFITGTGSTTVPLLATDLRFGSLLMGTGSLKNGSGSIFPQLFIQGRLPSASRASVTSTAGARILIRGTYAYITGGSTFGVYNVSNPLYPVLVGSVTTQSSSNDFDIEGKYAYVVSEAINKKSLTILDISNPSSPKIMKTYDMGLFSNDPFFGRSITVQGRYAYITGYTDAVAYRLYTFDISDPNNAFEVTSTAISSDTDRILAVGRYLYLPRKTTGVLALYDLQNPAGPSLVTTVAVGTGPSSVVVQDKYAYVSNGTDNTISVVDISAPSAPLVVGTVTVGTTPKEMVIMGRILYVLNTGTTTVSAVDVSNPRVPKVLGTFTTPASPSSIDVSGRHAYVTTSTSISVYDLGGAYIQQLEVGGLDTANAMIRGDINIVGTARITGGATVAQGLDITGPTAIYGGTGASALFVGSTTREGIKIEARGTPSASAEHILFGYQGTFDVNLFRSASQILKTSSSFHVVGTMSGSRVFATNGLSTSGSLAVHVGTARDPTLFANGTQKVGINTGSPNSSLTASGSFATTTRLVTATGAINGGDQIIFASGSSMITLTLPTAVGVIGRQYTIKKTSYTTATDVRPVIIATTSSQRIDGVSSWVLNNRGQQLRVVSDGTNWMTMDSSSYGLNGGYVAMGATLNQWYSAPANATALTTAVLTTTATIRVIPFIAQKVMTIEGMSVSVQTTAASSSVRLGIYRDSGRGYPGSLIVDAGLVATTSTGQRSICPSGCTTTGSGTLPVMIQPGLYWLALNNNSIAVTLRGFAVANLNAVSGYPTSYTTLRNVGWNIANTWGAFPTTFPVSANATTAVPLPAVTVRISD